MDWLHPAATSLIFSNPEIFRPRRGEFSPSRAELVALLGPIEVARPVGPSRHVAELPGEPDLSLLLPSNSWELYDVPERFSRSDQPVYDSPSLTTESPTVLRSCEAPPVFSDVYPQNFGTEASPVRTYVFHSVRTLLDNG